MKLHRIALSLLVILAAGCALAQSDAQKSFDKLKTLAGTWEGKAPNGQASEVVYQVTSGGSAIMSEIKGPEDMITMFHLDGGRLLMTHYCAAGNQPRMKGAMSPDGKTVTFDFVDATNLSSPEEGHMHHVVFTFADANHHSEEWTFLDHGKEMKETFELVRKN